MPRPEMTLTEEKDLENSKQITEYKLAKEIFSLSRDILLDPRSRRMKEFTQHGSTTVFEHCVAVAKFSLLIASFLEKVLRIKFDRRSLVRGALLHDYFLYDWHDPDPKNRIHGFTHPGTAWRNACRDFEINSLEADIIRRHMFPLTPIPPTHRESIVVCLADKWCAVCETFKIDVSSQVIDRVNTGIARAEEHEHGLALPVPVVEDI